MSLAALGKPCSDPSLQRAWHGISVRGTEADAERVSRISPHLGNYAAEIVIDDQAPVTFEPTFQKGHFTIWGDPIILLESVVRVVRLHRSPPPGAKEPSIDYSIAMSGSHAAPMPFFTGVVYEIFDKDAQGAIWATSTEIEAVQLVSKWLREFGPSYVDSMVLVRWADDKHASLVAEGVEIVNRMGATAMSQTDGSDFG